MCHSRTTGPGARALAITLIGGLALSGCSSLGDHNDVLLFGTDTKFALDVSADATSGGTPSVTFGYKRKEAVWMPLLTNGVCRGKAPPDYCKPADRDKAAARYTGSDSTKGGGRSDAYSVFASFGANLKGEANGSAHATVGLAQFFATGIAAQKLAENPQAANVLSVQPEATGQAIALAATGDPALVSAVVTAKTEAMKSLATRLYRCVGVTSLKSSLETKLAAEGFSQAEAARITSVQDVPAAQRMIDGFDETKIASAVDATCS